MANLQEIMNKRPAAKIEKLYPGVTKKEIADLTIRDLNNIAMHVMIEDGHTGNGVIFAPAVALGIIGRWAEENKKSIL